MKGRYPMNKDKLIETKRVVMYEIGQALEKANQHELNFNIQMMIASVLGDLTATLDDKLDEIIQSEPEETCITLPCKVGDTVYTIEKDNSPCEKCEHGEEVGYNVSACLLSHRDYECPSPEYYIEDHKVEGFEIGSGGIELVEEWGYDSKHIYEPYYLTREAAEAALSNEKAGE
jgi:hypothetical protein